MYKFNCKNCDTPVCYLTEATDVVRCGNCLTDDVAEKLTPNEIVELELPTVESNG
jgi:hypothetical protein